ncbi:MAG: lytic murein transglycosylase [Alphaproteobacteria bacterium]|nr:lytic murein transglycosylase [Alphaproteobacteria bacterium]
MMPVGFRFLFVIFLLFPFSVQAEDFQAWVKDFKAEARQKGISDEILDEAFEGVEPIARIIELDRKQPEGTLTFAQYKDRVISKARIEQGRSLYKKHKALLDRISKEYDVPAQYIVSLWGVETSYGNNTGGFSVVNALATLAHDGRRSEFFRGELINALKIVQQGHISLSKMKGSWAGAMGQNQFMPSSFFSFAVDGDGDGKRDIWTSLPDVFASTANYLSKSGWKGDERWGRQVKLPENFSKKHEGLDTKKNVNGWSDMGVQTLYGHPLPDADIKGSVIAPDGLDGSAFLVYHNFDVILKWNRSKYFATSVGLLADEIAYKE